MKSQLSILFAVLVARCYGQLFTGIDGYTFDSKTILCNQTFDDANSTGFYAWNPNLPQGQQAGQPDNNSGTTLPLNIGVTVAEQANVPNASVQWSLWLGTNGANYSNNLALGYDVCAFTIEPTSANTIYRGQNDTGNCLETLDSECVDALTNGATSYALQYTLTSDQLIRPNLTANSTATVCNQIANSLQANFPSSCKKFLNGSAIIGGGALTSYNTLNLYEDGCNITNSDNNSTFQHVYTYPKYTFDNDGVTTTWYDALNYFVVPVLLTYMPDANAQAPFNLGKAVSKLQCVRASHVNSGSITPPPAPLPTPFGSKGLSGGAIAGIVVGVVVGVALIAGAAFFLWRRKKKTKKLDTFNADNGDHSPGYTADAKEQQMPLAESQLQEPKELSPENEVRPELATRQSGPRVELADNSKVASYGHGNEKPAELLADVPDHETGL